MLTELTIQNYKSIVDLTVELGRINVFIGENGCGKTSILEALAMLCAAKTNTLGSDELYSRGVRIAKPSITLSSFQGRDRTGDAAIHLEVVDSGNSIRSSLQPTDRNDIYAKWIDVNVRRRSGPDPEYLRRVFSDSSSYPSQEDLAAFGFMPSSRTPPNFYANSASYLIYNLNTPALRGMHVESRRLPLGVNGEGMDLLISTFSKEEREKLLHYSHFISWLEDIIFDQDDRRKFDGHKLGKSTSLLYFRDRFMAADNNVLSAENANEGVLHVLFYLALFISKRTPSLFGIDNIEQALNPQLCRSLMKELAQIAKESDKQALITTHNPAILDGLNLRDDDQRLFVVYRSDEGDTCIRRIRLKEHKEEGGHSLKLSELWMRGFLGGIPKSF